MTKSEIIEAIRVCCDSLKIMNRDFTAEERKQIKIKIITLINQL